jgi:hypothetical protein
MKATSLAGSVVFAALASTAVLCTANDAAALGPLDLEVGAKAGVGTTPSNVPSASPNPLGFGLGARAGVAILGLYGGGSIIYYFGGSNNGVSTHSLMYGVEGGYGMKLLEILTLRAQVGVGNFENTVDLGSLGSSKNSNLYVEPGLTGLVSLPSGGWFVGADANLLVLPGVSQGNGQSQTDVAFTLHGQVGYKF